MTTLDVLIDSTLAWAFWLGPVRGSRQARPVAPDSSREHHGRVQALRPRVGTVVQPPYRSVFTSGYDFDITPAGRQALAESTPTEARNG